MSRATSASPGWRGRARPCRSSARRACRAPRGTRQDEERTEQQRDAEEDVGDPGQERVGPAAVEAGHDPEEATDQDDHDVVRRRRRRSRPRAVDGARVDVAAEVVVAEPGIGLGGSRAQCRGRRCRGSLPVNSCGKMAMSRKMTISTTEMMKAVGGSAPTRRPDHRDARLADRLRDPGAWASAR